MVFVKVVLYTQGEFSNERGLRLDAQAPVSTQYRNIAERLGLIVDYENHKLFMLSQERGKEHVVVSMVADNEQPQNVPNLDRACRMLFCDDFEGRRLLETQGREQLQQRMEKASVDTWHSKDPHNVYLVSLRYTTQVAGDIGSGKKRILTNGRGHLPSVIVEDLTAHAFTPELCERLGFGETPRPLADVFAIQPGEPESDMQALRDAADLLSFKLGSMTSLGSSIAGEFLGELYPSLVAIHTSHNVMLIATHDVGMYSCGPFWLDPAQFLDELPMHYGSGMEHMTDDIRKLLLSLGLIDPPAVKAPSVTTSASASPAKQGFFAAAASAAAEVELDSQTAADKVSAVDLDSQTDSAVKILMDDDEHFKQDDPVEEEPIGKIVPHARGKTAEVKVEFSPVILETVEATLSELIDVVEAAETAREQLAWCEEEAAADQALVEEQERFQMSMEQLFQATKIEVSPTEINLGDHMKVENIVKSDLADQVSTPFSSTIRTLVERFGQTVLMVEDLDESISSLMELADLADKVDEIAPPPKPEQDHLHHEFLSSGGPKVSYYPSEDPVVRCNPKSKTTYNAQPPAVLIPAPGLPLNTFDRSKPKPKQTNGETPSVTVSITQELAVQDNSQLLIRIYQALKARHATVKSTFMTMDKDGNGMIDGRELGNALRKLGISLTASEVRSVISSIERTAVGIEQQHDSSWSALSAHKQQRAADVDGYGRHVDGRVQYKELLDVVTQAARNAGLTTDHKTVRIRKGGILADSRGARSIKGVRGVRALNSLYRTQERVTGRGSSTLQEGVMALDVIGPILPVEFLEEGQYGIISADNLLYPVAAEAAAECKTLLQAENCFVGVDAVGSPVVQTVAELLQGLTLDHSQLHANTLARVIDTELETLFNAAVAVGNGRFLVLVLDKMLEKYDAEPAAILEQLCGSFIMNMTALEWHWLESSLEGVGGAMDLLWCGRCMVEFQADEDVDACRNLWKQMYSELRFQSTLRSGVDVIPESELEVWDAFVGRFVKSVDLSQTDARDDTVAVMVANCPNVEYLDLHDSKVTDGAVEEIVSGLPHLIWINIQETAITGQGVEQLNNAYETLDLLG